jgi:cell division septum initiation protein DivIVA
MSEPTTLDAVIRDLALVLSEIRSLKADNERFNERLETYQKSSDIIVRLAFALIVSSTVALAISAITLIVKFLTNS